MQKWVKSIHSLFRNDLWVSKKYAGKKLLFLFFRLPKAEINPFQRVWRVCERLPSWHKFGLKDFISEHLLIIVRDMSNFSAPGYTSLIMPVSACISPNLTLRESSSLNIRKN